MFQLPVNEFVVQCDMAERQRESLSETELIDSVRWFEPTVTIRPNLFSLATRHLGSWFIAIGQQLENYALDVVPAVK